MSVKLILDKRATAPGSPAPIRIRIINNRQCCFITTGVRVPPSHWSEEAGAVLGYPDAAEINRRLVRKLDEVENALFEALGELGKDAPITQVRDMILALTDSEKAVKRTESKGARFFDRFVVFADSKANRKTRDSYRQTAARLKAFDSRIKARTFDDIDAVWLKRFDAFMAQTSPSANARAVHMRNIRSAFNDAITSGVTENYPFRRFKIKTQPTAKRALTLEQLRTLRDYPVEPYQEKYRDLFMLCFYLRGINGADLFTAKHSDVTAGRLVLRRSKTGQPLDIKIEPEAQALLDKYKGKRYLLNILDTYTDYTDFLRRMSSELKRIGPMKRVGLGGKKVIEPLFPKLSQYWCRHTWATMAAELDIPKETIAAGLGHAGRSVTDIYIRFNYKKVDEANRRVIDYICSGKI